MSKNNISPLLSKNLSKKNITHGFFTKKGGISKKNNFSLNCSYNSNDLKTNIIKNRKLVCNFHKLDIDNLKTIKQVHGNKIVIVSDLKKETSTIEADAMITDKPNIILGILTADCAPILVLDYEKNIIAAIHIGWKGAIKNILTKTLKAFIKMGSKINDINIAIGPCIGPESYEVKKDFYDKFTKYNLNNKNYFYNFNSNKFKFDLPQYIIDEAINNGVIKDNITNINKDTFNEKNNFFSARRSLKLKHDDYGRNISIIMIK